MLFGAMVILNLFIGVIMNGMEEAREENDAREAQLRGDRPATLAEDIEVLQGELSTLQNRLMILHHRALETDKSKS
jgi:voltage-gated sodium channel